MMAALSKPEQSQTKAAAATLTRTLQTAVGRVLKRAICTAGIIILFATHQFGHFVQMEFAFLQINNHLSISHLLYPSIS